MTYNALTHLAKTVFPYGATEKLMVMLSVYFDESESNAPNVPRVHTVAGYLSTVEKWEEFTQKWQEFLDREGLPPFSMKKFSNPHDKLYGSWSESKKRLVIRILHKLIKEAYLKSFSCSISLDAFDELTVPQKYVLGTKYSFAAIDCLKRIKRVCDENEWNDPIAYVFEKGGQHENQLKEILTEGVIEDHRDYYRVGSVTWDFKKLPPLQAADMLAYETRKEMCRRLSGSKRKIRQSLANLSDAQRDTWSYVDKKYFNEVLAYEHVQKALADPQVAVIAADYDRRGRL